ncbi:MAG: hypothetical protein HUJ66_01485 [Oscillospiraceae bacterium]|nr:hypothetical protein [Oscillospiraceae bacterium]
MKKLVAFLLIFVLLFAMSAVAFAATDVTSPEDTNGDHDDDSPQTGDLANILWVAVAAVLALGVAFFCGKKLVAQK